jgi:hypothetical protein
MRVLPVLVLLAAPVLAAPLIGCSGAPVGADGKSADEIAVEAGRNACDPRARLLGNPQGGAFPMATTELQRRNATCRDIGPRNLIEEEGEAPAR